MQKSKEPESDKLGIGIGGGDFMPNMQASSPPPQKQGENSNRRLIAIYFIIVIILIYSYYSIITGCYKINEGLGDISIGLSIIYILTSKTKK